MRTTETPQAGTRATVQLIGAEADRCLNEPDFSGQVISAGSRAVYISAEDGYVLAACRPEQQPHPRSLLTDLDLSILQVGMNAWVEGAELHFANGTSLGLNHGPVWSREPVRPISATALPELGYRFDELLRVARGLHRGENLGLVLSSLANESENAANETAAMPDRVSPLVAAGVKQISELLPLCGSGDLEAVLENSRNLIGLGPGLTPSGDDFVGGLLFMSHHLHAAYPAEFWRDSEKVGAFLVWSAAMTNRISHALLTDLAQGRSHESLHDLADGLLNAHQRFDVAPLVRRVTEIGNSSGWDILTGIMAGMLLVVNRSSA